MANYDNAQKEPLFEFKTLLTKEEYDYILEKNPSLVGDLQTNYYFDTSRFSLKASEAILRVKRTDKKLVLILERKKGYAFQKLEEPITEEEFELMLKDKVVSNPVIKLELQDLVKDQKIDNFMNFATYRIYVPYKNTRFAIDCCEYVNTVDYELEFQTKNRDMGRVAFVNLIKEYNIEYKKSQVKLKRAYQALKDDF